LVALNNMARFREAIAFAKTMQEAGVELPGYAQAALGNSLASLNRPGQSLPYLRKAVQENPFDVAAGMQLYYSLIDAGKYREADQHLTEHITRQAYWKGDDFIGETLANEARIQADCARAVGLALGLDPKGAERRLSTLADVAPGSSDLRIAFAEVELIRGRPRAALEEAHQSLALEPEMSSAQAAVLRARTETGDWKGLPAELSRLQERYPFDADVRTASRTWRNETAPRLEMEVTHSRSTAVQSPGKDTVWHSTYRAPGIGEDQDLVMLLEQVSEWGTFPEGDANERRTGATLQKVQKNNRFGLNAGAVDGGTFFGGAFWEWQPLDDWQFEVRAERNSLEAPVRARRGGTTADYYSIGGQKSWFEEGELSWALSWLSYSDGNDQLQVQTDGRRRVWFTPGWELFAGAGLSASRGEAAPDVVYYNPSADLAPEVSMTLHQQIRGDLSQEAKATLGAYFQEGFGPRGFGGLSYRFEWSILQTGSLFAQAQWTTQPFDGTPERSRELQFGFTLLF
jgi:tetratricopeptide (TPR) repeat protein